MPLVDELSSSRSKSSLIHLCCTLVALLYAPHLVAAQSKHALQLNLEGYSDDATHTAESNIGGVLMDTQETEVGRSPAFALSLQYLLPLTDHLRIGPGVRYLSSYRYLDDNEQDPNAQGTLIGRLFEVYARAELTIGLTDALALLPALDFGMPFLFAAGDLQRDLDQKKQQGYNVNSLPRIGFLIGAELACRYQLNDYLFLRGGLGLQHDRITLYDASTDGDRGLVSRYISLTRIRALVGAEVQF